MYDSTSRQPLAMWGETEREKIFQLISLEDTVLALTASGMYLFSADIPDTSQTFAILEPTHHSPCTELYNTVSVCVPHTRDAAAGEVWACSQRGQWLQVLSPRDLSVKLEIEIPPSQNKKLRHLVTATQGEMSWVFLADRHTMMRYDTRTKCHDGTLDCHAAYWGSGDPCDPDHLRLGRITSLVAGDDGLLYVGNGAGIILLVRPDTLEVSSHLQAYEGPVRCLQMVPMSEAFSRMISSFDESTGSMRPNSSSNTMSNTPSTSSFDSVLTSPPPFPSTPISPVANDDRSVLLTLGTGYKGVVAGATNHPDNFLLPYGLTSCPCCTHFLTQPRPLPLANYLLLWSREPTSRCYGDADTREEHLDSSSE